MPRVTEAGPLPMAAHGTTDPGGTQFDHAHGPSHFTTQEEARPSRCHTFVPDMRRRQPSPRQHVARAEAEGSHSAACVAPNLRFGAPLALIVARGVREHQAGGRAAAGGSRQALLRPRKYRRLAAKARLHPCCAVRLKPCSVCVVGSLGCSSVTRPTRTTPATAEGELRPSSRRPIARALQCALLTSESARKGGGGRRGLRGSWGVALGQGGGRDGDTVERAEPGAKWEVDGEAVCRTSTGWLRNNPK